MDKMNALDTEIRLFGVANDSIVDGPGLRYAIYTQGCSHHCEGCHNKESWAFKGGTVTSVKAILDDIEKNKLVKDVTLSGGDPFEQAKPVAILARELKRKGYGLWAYSGYTLEELEQMADADSDVKTILDSIDVLVDGRFEMTKKSLGLKWKGSSNQRAIDMRKTRNSGEIILFQEVEIPTEIPPNW